MVRLSRLGRVLRERCYGRVKSHESASERGCVERLKSGITPISEGRKINTHALSGAEFHVGVQRLQ